MRSLCICVLMIGACAVAFTTAAPAVPAPATDSELVELFLRSDRPALTSYRAWRRLEASSMGGRMAAFVEAWTFVENGRFGFEIIREEGSSLIRGRVLRKALETEQENFNRGEVRHVELTRDNYDFQFRSMTGDLAEIAVLPRRSSPMLLKGAVTVSRENGDIVRLEGSPSERPSWWTNRVDITRRYTRIDGVRVPVEMSSRADVRIAGESTFQMTYDYTMINGRPTKTVTRNRR